jgi:hypothetical protein
MIADITGGLEIKWCISSSEGIDLEGQNQDRFVIE